MPTNEGCILHVEDDPNDVLLLETAFQDVGVTTPVFVATDGRIAISYLAGEGQFADRERHPLPRLVLLDLDLPGGSGLDVLRWIRRDSSLRDLPVIILTASAIPGDVRAAYAQGANAYLVKPVSVVARTEMVRQIKLFWLGPRQLAASPGWNAAPDVGNRLAPPR
jgi:CheY-like chemotaxis protein